MDWLQIIGYAGSVLVAVSLMMNSIVRLRWVNLFGAGIFATYGLLIGAYPVFILNGFITVVDIYYLYQLRRAKDTFELLAVEPGKAPFLGLFLKYYQEEIQKFFPEFDLNKIPDARCIFVLRNIRPVGLFICQPKDDYLQIHLDFVIPEYRDFRNAHFLYCRNRGLLDEGEFQGFIACTEVPKHRDYLLKIGFKPWPQIGGNYYFLDPAQTCK